MKKILALSALLLLSLTACGIRNANPPSDAAQTVVSASAAPGVVPVTAVWTNEADGSIYQEQLFDEKGQPVKEVSYHDGEPNAYFLYEYDDSGNMTRTRGYHMDGTMYFGSRFEYDDGGNTVAYYDLSVEESKTPTITYENELDEGGRLVRQTSTHTDPGMQYMDTVTTYTYDEKGRLVTEEVSYADAELASYDSRTEYVYDEDGNQTEYHTYISSNGEETWYNLSEYNEYGLRIRLVMGSNSETDADKQELSVSYTYAK